MALCQQQKLANSTAAMASLHYGCGAPLRQAGSRSLALPVRATAALLERAPAMLQDKPVTISISTHFQAAFGEGLKVVGSHPALGAWDVAAAPDMQWTPGHRWVARVSVPQRAAFEFKLVHLALGGVAWEPSANRPLVAAYGEGELPEEAALEVACTFGHPELTAVQLARSAELAAADREEAAWDPATQGLPADLTEDLSMQALKAVRSEPKNEAAPVAAASWEAVKQSAPEFQTELAPTQDAPAIVPAEPSAAVEAKAPAKAQSLEAVGKAASFAAVGLAAGVLMSALAIDLTDAALASALFAAGATLLPAKDAKVAQKTAATVLSGGLSATEALARGFGLKSHAERRAEATAAAGQLLLDGASTVEDAEQRLAASIAEAEALLGQSTAVDTMELTSQAAAGVTVAAALSAVAASKGEAEEAC